MKHSIALLYLLLLAPIPALAGTSANHSDGAVIIGPAATTTCDNTTEGLIRYSSSDNAHEFCDGTDWRSVVVTDDPGDATVDTTETGYFVITSGTWNGALGGKAGADTKCLSDLTANDWMGKADATSRGMLDDEHVFAFLCTTSCRNALPNVKYYFAVSGDNTKGGSYFTTDSSGWGPNDNANWSGSTYFDGAKSYWTGNVSSSSTSWSDSGNHGSGWYCPDSWTDGTSASTGGKGTSNSTSSTRWRNGTTTCNNSYYLVCLVHP